MNLHCMNITIEFVDINMHEDRWSKCTRACGGEGIYNPKFPIASALLPNIGNMRLINAKTMGGKDTSGIFVSTWKCKMCVDIVNLIHL